MRKRWWMALGPVLLGFLLALAVIAFYPVPKQAPMEAKLQDAAAASTESFKNRYKKVQALSDPDHPFIPFFGSSEWLRMDTFHPSVLAEAYDRPYRPYLMGQRGAVSLVHILGMQQIRDQLKGKKAVFVISPQWFIKEGIRPEFLDKYLATDQLTAFLLKDRQEVSDVDRMIAKRLLEVRPSIAFHSLLQRLSQGHVLTSQELTWVRWMDALTNREAEVFGQWSSSGKYDRIVMKKAGELPEKFSYQTLDKLAEKEARASTTNNPYGLENRFYEQKVAGNEAELQGSQKQIDYRNSPEYTDFQLLLSQIAELKMDVIFVIPPINEKWIAFTGMSKDMYQATADKIKYQLTSQGFTNVADLSDIGKEPYHMEDTIHMGWKGWLDFDRAVDPFLRKPYQVPQIHLNEKFLSPTWAKQSSGWSR